MKEKICKIIKGNIFIIAFAMAMISTYALDVRFDFEANQLKYMEMSQYIFPLSIIVIYNSYKIILEKYKNDKKDAKRLLIVSYIFGIIISIFMVIGRLSLVTYDPKVVSFSNTKIIFTKRLIVFIFLTILGFTIFAKNALVSLFNIFEKIENNRKKKQVNNIESVDNKVEKNINEKDIKKNSNKIKFLEANRKSFILVAIILFIVWIPTLLARYPGICGYDNKYQYTQVHLGRYTNDHPLLHTLLYGGIIELGYRIFGTFNSGIALASIVKMIFASIICSYLLYYLAKKNAPMIFRKILFCFFIFYQPIAQHIMIGHKDITFSILILLITIHLIEIVSNTKKYFGKNSNIVVFAILILLSLFYRHNALYAYVLILPILSLFLVLFRKKQNIKRKDGVVEKIDLIKNDQIIKVIFAFILSIFVYTITIKVITTYTPIKSGNNIEKYSVLSQIIARNVKYNEDKLTEEDKEKIGKFFYDLDITTEEKIEKIKKEYMPWFADPMKNSLIEREVSKNEKEFVKFGISMIKRFKMDSIQAIFSQTYLYYYPKYQLYIPIYKTTTDDTGPNFKMLDMYPDAKIDKSEKIINYTNNMYYGYIPVFSLFVNIAYILYFVFASFMYVIYKKRYIYMVAFLPLFGIYISVLFSPIGGETRYILPLFTTSTVLIPFAIGVLDNNYEKL